MLIETAISSVKSVVLISVYGINLTSEVETTDDMDHWRFLDTLPPDYYPSLLVILEGGVSVFERQLKA